MVEAVELDNMQGISCFIPRIGMQFDTEDEAYKFYNDYGAVKGFSVRKEYVNRDKEGVVTSRRYTCSKEGIRRQDPRESRTRAARAQTKTGCGTRMGIHLKKDLKKYVVTDFVALHNHELHTSECCHMMGSQWRMNESHAIEAETAEDAGLPLTKSYDLMVRQVGGPHNLGHTREDMKRHLRNRRERGLKYGEAGNMLHYFQERLANNPSFFYGVQVDCEEQITNIFWADAAMRVDYSFFGDVVTFDTTYRTNKDYRPLGVFVGFNHHRQMVIFGATLLYDETKESFEWVFQTFLEAMSGKYPRTIFTDQDAAMAGAIRGVMPQSFHGLCTFHIRRNFVKHLANHFKSDSAVCDGFMACMHRIEEEDEFLNVWEGMMKVEELKNNHWLMGMFAVRKKWARCYLRQQWTAGMRSTQLSESLNAAIKNHLKADHNLIQFFTYFSTVIEKRRYKENGAEYNSRQKLPTLSLKNSPMLKQVSSLYTPHIFLLFQDEFDESSALLVSQKETHGDLYNFVVSWYNGGGHQVVVYNSAHTSVNCNCKKFESEGILCCHCLKVLDHVGIKVVPSVYILKRWTREARNGLVFDNIGCEIVTDPHLLVAERFRKMCPNLVKIASRAATCPKVSSYFANAVSDLSKQVERILSTNIDESVTVGLPHANDNVEVGVEHNFKGIKKRGADKPKKEMRSWMDTGRRRKHRGATPSSSQKLAGLGRGSQQTTDNEYAGSCYSSNASISVNGNSNTDSGLGTRTITSESITDRMKFRTAEDGRPLMQHGIQSAPCWPSFTALLSNYAGPHIPGEGCDPGSSGPM